MFSNLHIKKASLDKQVAEELVNKLERGLAHLLGRHYNEPKVNLNGIGKQLEEL